MTASNKNLYHVLIIKELSHQRIFILQEDRYSLGRKPQNDIVIKDKQVSRYHATIIKRKENDNRTFFWIYDGDLKNNKSSNGLIVNQKLCNSHCLKKGDVILLGYNVQLQYYQFAKHTLDLLKLIEAQ